MTEDQEKLRKAILLLDCALPFFVNEAKREERRYDGSGLREVTCKNRLKSVRHMINNVGPSVGYYPHDDA